MSFDEKFIDRNIAELCMEYDKICGANKNLARMAPDFVDGLTPVQKRALYTIFRKNSGKDFRKLATIAGETFGTLHPHSPDSIGESLVGLAQDWNNNIPLIQGEGNWGNVAGDVAGASRYIKARLSKYAYECFFKDWKDSVVDMVMAYDEETMEPLYLPAKYPNVLLNGSLGIGYGMASNIPPFNFKEIVETCIKLMEDPEAIIAPIPDSPTGCDIVESDFKKIVESGNGVYTMRCKYEIDAEHNLIRIINLPYQVVVNTIRERIADIKEKNGLAELVAMNDFSGKNVDLQLTIRTDVNPYKFMRKLIQEVGGLEKTYPVNILVINDFESFDYSIKDLILAWIDYRREQKRIVVSHKRTTLLAEQRTNDVKIFIMNEQNLNESIKLFRQSKNRDEIEERLIKTYRHSEIKMDSLQAKTLSGMRFYELSEESRNECLIRREELLREIKEVEMTLSEENGIDKLIISELREGVKMFGNPRKSNVVPVKISVDTEVAGTCILQLSSDGVMTRKVATNVHEEPVPVDSNGFAVKVENDCSFIAVDEDGSFAFVKVSEIPIDQEVPLNRYIRQPLGKIIGLLPYDIESTKCVILISKLGLMKKVKIADMRPSKRPCIEMSREDKIVRGIVVGSMTDKDILIYTKEGMGQRLDPNEIRITSFIAKGGGGFKLSPDDEIIGCYSIDPVNQYLLYVTIKGKMRLNLTQYLPLRDSKHDAMVRLISLPDRDKLLGIIGCNKFDKLNIFYDDSTTELVEISTLEEGTMSSEPKKVTKKNAVSTNIVKVKLV